jgi:hypothetical protein
MKSISFLVEIEIVRKEWYNSEGIDFAAVRYFTY